MWVRVLWQAVNELLQGPVYSWPEFCELFVSSLKNEPGVPLMHAALRDCGSAFVATRHTCASKNWMHAWRMRSASRRACAYMAYVTNDAGLTCTFVQRDRSTGRFETDPLTFAPASFDFLTKPLAQPVNSKHAQTSSTPTERAPWDTSASTSASEAPNAYASGILGVGMHGIQLMV